MQECIFCKIVKSEIASVKIFEDEKVFAFLDANPDTPGHTLVVPKTQFANIFDIDKDTLQAVIVAGKDIAANLRSSLGAIGINMSSNNGKQAGQIVNHFHIHIIPRYEDDGL